MDAGPVSLVLGEAVTWVMTVPFGHQPVSVDLGHDRSRGDRRRPPIPFNDGPLGIAERGESHGVNEDKLGRIRKPHEGLAHGETGGLEDIDPINSHGVRFAETNGQGLGPDLFRQAFPLNFSEELRVAEASDASCRIEDHRGRHHGSSEGATPDLVYSGDQSEPLAPGLTLKAIEPARTGE